MALIKCADCGNDVSDRAPACPKCGAPIATFVPAFTPASTPAPEPFTIPPVTPIEQTGKIYKAEMLIGGIVAGLGITAVFVGSPTLGIFMLVIGVGCYFVGRIGAWWHHE